MGIKQYILIPVTQGFTYTYLVTITLSQVILAIIMAMVSNYTQLMTITLLQVILAIVMTGVST